MNERHISSQFDAELSGICARVLEMGGLVESQTVQAMYALTHFSGETAAQVLEAEQRVNSMEVEIDLELQRTIAMRQPAASDLRLLIAVSKASGNLERVGDEAARVSQRTAMFHLGYLVEEGATEKMFTSPDDKRTQDYITGRFG